MKRLLLLLGIIAAACTADATNYYVSAAGNDGALGTSPATAWKSLAKVNSFTFAANDSILLRRGDVFWGALVPGRNNLNFAAYGTGARPLITGFVTLSSWTASGAGIYKSSVVTKNYLNMVTINGTPAQIGRYPNATDANGGYLAFEAATANSITDNELTSAVNWTGAEVAIRKNGWVIDRCIITNHNASTITYRIGRNANTGNTPLLSNAKLGHGYFIMDDIRTLDQFGEWFYDTTAKTLSVYFGTNAPSAYSVKVSTVDTLMNLASRTYISVNEIDFEGGNSSGIYSYNADNIKIQNCNFRNIGSRAIHIFATSNVLVENVNTNNVLSNAIQVISRTKNNCTIRNCRVTNTGQYSGMGSFYEDCDYKGIYITMQSGILIENNIVDTVGLAGIQFNGNDVVVQKNLVNYFCYRLHDNGGIYTFANGTDAAPGTIYTNRIVRNNIIMNGISAPFGTNSPNPFCAGIYLDGRTMNVLVQDNTVFNSSKNGIHCNNPANITIRGNTFYNNLQDISFMRWAWGSITNLTIKQNISFPATDVQRNLYYTNAALNTPVPKTLNADLAALGSIDSNYFNTFTDAGFNFEIYGTEGGSNIPYSPYSLDGWRAGTGHDIRSKRPAPKISPYTITSTIGSNLFANTQFNTNITGVTLFGSSTTAAWDNTGKLTGTGSLRIDFAAPVANRYSLLHSPIGAVSSAKKYVLRFKILGTTSNGIVRAYIRKTASPYNNLVTTQTKAFGLSKITQEFLFDGPTTDAGGSFVIEVEQNSGTTYIDDVEFYEVTATLNSVASQLRFEYNATHAPKTIALDAKYAGVDSTIYNGTITLQPFTSKVLIKVGVIDTLPVSNAGPDKQVYLPADTVILNGSASGSAIASYTWTKISGPASFSIVSASSAVTKVSGLVLGTYRFELRVVDVRGFVSRDTVSVNVSTILPVNIVSFNAAMRNNKTNLTWVTASEVNCSHYIIERSSNGRDFTAIGQVVSNNSNQRSSYTATDNTPFSGMNYYRLVMVDRDGQTTYSKVIAVNMSSRQSFVTEKIQVTAGSIQLNVNSSKEQLLTVIMADALGRVVFKKQVPLTAGTNTIAAPVRSAAKNVYYVKMCTNDSHSVRTVLSE